MHKWRTGPRTGSRGPKLIKVFLSPDDEIKKYLVDDDRIVRYWRGTDLRPVVHA